MSMVQEITLIIVTKKEEKEVLPLTILPRSQLNKCEIIICDDEGISSARNTGINRATTDKIIFIDDDAIPVEGYIDRAVNNLENYPIITGRVIDTGHPWVRKTSHHYNQGDKLKKTNRIIGCNMGFRKEVFNSIGMFDENINWGHDEKEFVERASQQYDIYYDPNMTVKHPYASTIPDYLRKKYRLGLADVYYWNKHDRYVWQNVLLSSISPKHYLDYSLKGTLVKSLGGILRSYGRFAGYYQYYKDNKI